MQNFTWKVLRHLVYLGSWEAGIWYEWFGGWTPTMLGMGIASWLPPDSRQVEFELKCYAGVSSWLFPDSSASLAAYICCWVLVSIVQQKQPKHFVNAISQRNTSCVQGFTGWKKVYKGHYSELSHVLKGVVLTQLSPRLCSPSSTAACPKRGIHRRARGWRLCCSQWPKYDHIQCESMKDDLSIRWSSKLTWQQQPPPRSLHILFFCRGIRMKLYFPLLFGWGEHPKFFSEYQLVQDFFPSAVGGAVFHTIWLETPIFYPTSGSPPYIKSVLPQHFWGDFEPVHWRSVGGLQQVPWNIEVGRSFFFEWMGICSDGCDGSLFLEKSPLKSVKQGLSIYIPISPRGNVSWKKLLLEGL